MLIAVWIVSALLALVYLGAGATKALQPKNKLEARMGGWVNDFSATQVKLIGVVEILGAIGLILPPLTGIAPILAAFAAVGLVLVQLGAIIVHVRRGEQKQLPANVVLLLLALFVALARFGVFGAL